MTMQKIKYNGSIVAGSLLVRESLIITRLLLDYIDDQAWHHAIVIDNVLQKRSPATAKRQSSLIKARLTLMKPELWKLIDKGTSEVATQALLAASIKHSPLLGDFMNKVVKSNWQVFKKKITIKDWQNYMETCFQLDPHTQNWTDATQFKLKQIVFRILAEAKYISDTRKCELLPVSLTSDVKKYLVNNSEDYVLKCMEITP